MTYVGVKERVGMIADFVAWVTPAVLAVAVVVCAAGEDFWWSAVGGTVWDVLHAVGLAI